jgi:hypothetical protein
LLQLAFGKTTKYSNTAMNKLWLRKCTFAIIYATQTPPSVKPAVSGLNVGDTFTYSLKGNSPLVGLDAVTPDYFYQYNATDYYNVTITGINGTEVSLDTVWRFTNGTEINGKQTIDLSNGMKTGQSGFWAIYVSNLNVNDLLRPQGYDGLIVNSTDTKSYADSTRQRNVWAIEAEFSSINDPTGSTLRYDHMHVYFDKQTGMLESLSNVQVYTNPQMSLTITWQLTDCSVWAVK